MNLPCFACPILFDDINQLCKHIRNVHKIRGQNTYQCKLCNKILGELDAFKRHLERCMRKTKQLDCRQKNHISKPTNETVNPKGSANLRLFEKSIHNSALKFALKMSSKMDIPRNFVFEMIEDFQEYILVGIKEGIDDVIIPLFQENSKKNIVEAFAEICSGVFCNVETEGKLDSELKDAKVIFPLKKFPIGAIVNRSNIAEQSDTEEDGEQSEDDGNATLFDIFGESPTEIDMETEQTGESEFEDSRFDICDERIKISTGTLMPIKFQLQRFFEVKGVFKTIMDNTHKILNENNLNHFIKGSLWKSKLSAFTADQIVIPYHLYADETQINNPLGTHCSPGLENCVYYSFPTIPAQFASRLQNIFVAMLTSAADTKKFGPDACFEPLVHELNKLAEHGVKITVDGKEETIYFVLGIFLGDNASLNSILGFCPFASNVFCKHCRLTKKETQTQTVEDGSMIRNEENFAEDLLINDEKETGIKWESVFNKIFLFHVVHSAGVDIMHDLSEGVLRYNMSAIILNLLKKKVFTLKTLNERKQNFVYDHLDRGNKSGNIIRKKLRQGSLKMTASEMMTFFQVFPFLIGDLVSPNDEAWIFYLKTVEVVDLVFLRSFTDADLMKLKNSIDEMNSMYISLFNQTLKPKHHFLTHYPRLIECFGPLRYISSMRYEAKHRIVKKYTKNTESRKNISFSIGRKLQYDFARLIMNGDSLIDKLDYKHTSTITLLSQSYFSNIENSPLLNEMAQIAISEVESLEMNGIFFSNDLFIPEENNIGEIIVWRICKILLLPRGDEKHSYLLCKKYSKTEWCPHYASYEVTELNSDENMVFKSVSDLLQTHIRPISIYSFNGKEMFRLRNN